MKRILIALLMLIAPVVASAQTTTVTGHVKFPDTTVPANAQVCFTLINFSPNVPRVIGTGAIISQRNYCIAPAADGSFSTSLYGNSVISPVATNWRVDYIWNGIQQSSETFLINHSPFNLDTEVPLSSTTPAGPNQLVTQAFSFTQLTPALTWTITHNFNDPNTIVYAADLNGNQIFPDSTNCRTNPNVCTLTFVTAQAGFAIAMHAGAINIASNQPNAVLQNPLGSQTVDNGQSLTISGQFNAVSGGLFSGSFAGTPALTGLWTFNSGLTSSGPNTLNGGGSTAGTWSHAGAHTFNATAAFTASPAFSVTSNTVISNLNSSLLLGNNWAAPGAIGGMTPGAGTFTTLTANTSLSINSGATLTTSNQSGTGNLCMTSGCSLTSPTIATPVINGTPTGTSLQGTDTKLLTSGTVSGTGVALCTSANGGATTSGCPATIIRTGSNTSVCLTGSGAYVQCSTTVNWSSAFADTGYMPSCSLVGTITGFPYIVGVTKATGSVTVTISDGSANGATASTAQEIDCIGIHP